MKIPRPYVRPDETPRTDKPLPLPAGGALSAAGYSLSRLQIDVPPIQRAPDPAIDQDHFERTGQERPMPAMSMPEAASAYAPFEAVGHAGGAYSSVGPVGGAPSPAGAGGAAYATFDGPSRGGGAYAPFGAAEAGAYSSVGSVGGAYSPVGPVGVPVGPGGGEASHPTDGGASTTLNTLPIQEGTTLKGFSKGAEYEGEDQKLGWRADIGPEAKAKRESPDPAVREAQAALAERSDVRLTKYLDADQRAGFQATAGDDGLLRGAGGDLLDTRGGGGGGHDATANSHIFALGTEGKLHTASDKENDFARKDFIDRKAGEGMARPAAAAMAGGQGLIDRMFHHSSFYAGGAVAGAGEIRADQGRLKEITDGSGHYKPGGDATFQTVDHMARSKAEGGLGVGMRDEDEREARVTLIGKGAGQQRVSLPASSYLQTQGNETQIRAKQGMLDQLHSTVPQAADASSALGGPDFGGIAHAPRPATTYADGSQLRPATVYADQSQLSPPAAGPSPAPAYDDTDDTSGLGAASASPYSSVGARAYDDLSALTSHASSPYSPVPAAEYSDPGGLGVPSASPYSTP